MDAADAHRAATSALHWSHVYPVMKMRPPRPAGALRDRPIALIGEHPRPTHLCRAAVEIATCASPIAPSIALLTHAVRSLTSSAPGAG